MGRRQKEMGTVFTLLFMMMLSSCATVPREEFDAYRTCFAQARTAAEDIVLGAKTAAKTLADNPANKDPASTRVVKLTRRLQDAEARLLALQTIDRYNTVLVKLAEGRNPKALQGDLKDFGVALQACGSSTLMELAGKAIPYAGIAAEIIALAEDTKNREEFRRLVQKGQEPVAGILDILIADANNIREIVAQQWSSKREPYAARVDNLRFQFEAVAKECQATPEIVSIINRTDGIRQALAGSPLPKIKHASGPQPPTAAQITMLGLIAEATQEAVVAANGITDKIKAHQTVIDEYQKLLAATKQTFAELEQAIRSKRRLATVDFIRRTLAIRQALLELREGV